MFRRRGVTVRAAARLSDSRQVPEGINDAQLKQAPGQGCRRTQSRITSRIQTPGGAPVVAGIQE
jgi:hypothetical protein